MHIIDVKMQNKNESSFPKKYSSLINCLKFFALNKEGTVEEVAEFINKDYTTAMRTIKKLGKRGLIRLERLERTNTKGREKKIYRITLRGLFLWMIIERRDAEENFEKIVSAHKDKLLTFKKWQYFKEKGLAEYIKAKFFESLSHYEFIEASFPLLMKLTYGDISPTGSSFTFLQVDEEALAKPADFDILQLNLMTYPPEHVKRNFKNEWENLVSLYKAIEEDYELKRFKDMIIFEREREYDQKLKAINAWKQFLRVSGN